MEFNTNQTGHEPYGESAAERYFHKLYVDSDYSAGYGRSGLGMDTAQSRHAPLAAAQGHYDPLAPAQSLRTGSPLLKASPIHPALPEAAGSYLTVGNPLHTHSASDYLAAPAITPARDPLEELVSHRSAVLKSQVECLARQLYERARIHESNLDKLQSEEIKLDTELMKLDQVTHGNWLNTDRDMMRRRDSLEHELSSLQGQKRDEHTSFWKDRVLLRKELTELAGAYAAARAREGIMGWVKGYGI